MTGYSWLVCNGAGEFGSVVQWLRRDPFKVENWDRNPAESSEILV